MIDPRTTVGLDAIVHELETLADKLRTLAQGDDWELPGPRLFSTPAGEIKGALTKLKAGAFEMAWNHFKEIRGLSNADDDSRAKEELKHEFSVTAGLEYRLLENYFGNLASQADELALEAILKEARKAVPHRFFNPSYGEDKGKPADLVRKSVVKLRLWRDSYSPDRLSTYSRSELAALDKLGQVVVLGVKPSQAQAHLLTRHYTYRQDCNGKRELSYGPFVGAQSFKNSRFDLKFKDHETALDFAHMLATGEPRISTVLQAPLAAPELVGQSV